MVLINANSTALNIGDPMPHFSLPATDGLTIHSKEIKDPVLVVIFTCNHCPYAQAYEERIQTLAEDLDPTSASHSAKATRDKKATVGRQEGVQFVLINANDATNYPEDDFEHMKEKVKKNCYSFPYCHDASQEVARSYGALCTPHSFVFDRKRNLKYKGRVDDNWERPDLVTEHNLADACYALADGKEPPVHEANAIGCSIKWKETSTV